MKILLDYVFPISVLESIPEASTAFLRQVALVCRPKEGQTAGTLTTCVNMTEVGVLTANVEAQQLFNAGLSRVMILLADDLDLEDYMTLHAGEFFTLLISSDFSDVDIETVVEQPATDDTPAVPSTLKVQDITYTAAEGGVSGDAITIEYIADAASGDEALVSVLLSAITVDIDPAATKASTIAAAIGLDVSASGLVLAEVDDGDEDDIQAVTGEALALTGGVDLIPGDEEILAEEGLNVGAFSGVVGLQTNDLELADEQAAISKRCAFFASQTHKAKNMCYAFGKLLSTAANWLNQQYIEMPFNDGVDEIGEADALFDDKISFVINDDDYANRLALFACGGKAIVAPYILKNLMIDLQSRALQWIASNQPQYTIKEATLLETRLQQDVIQSYIDRRWIESGSVSITLQAQNFVASGAISVPSPKALWRVLSQMTETN